MHNLVKLPNSRKCYCCHGYGSRRSTKLSTMFKCGFCNVPICKPIKIDCWNLRLQGLPKKKVLPSK